MTVICYYTCQCCLQCSILAFYKRLRLADIGGRYMRHILYALMGVSITNNIIAFSLQQVFTRVLSYRLQGGRYFIVMWFTYSSINLLTDLIIWSLPLPTIFSSLSNFSSRKKALLVLVFSMGAMSWCNSILRVSLRQYVIAFKDDPSYNAPIFIVLYVSEISLAMTYVSLVTLRPLVVQITKGLNNLRGKPTSNDKSYQSGESQTLAQLDGNGSRSGGSRTTGYKGGFRRNMNVDEERATVDQELEEWKDDVLDNQASQFAHQSCSCPCRGDVIELGSVVAHASPCPRSQIQVPTPAATTHGTTHRLNCSSSGGTLRTNSTTIASAYQYAHLRPPCDGLPSSVNFVGHLGRGPFLSILGMWLWV